MRTTSTCPPTGHSSDQAELQQHERNRRSWFHSVLFAISVAVTWCIAFDLEFPRVGLVRLDATEKILEDLHDSICE